MIPDVLKYPFQSRALGGDGLSGPVSQMDLWRALAPLTLIIFIMGASRTIVSALLARFETATDELAGFGVGLHLTFMLLSPFFQIDQMGLTYARSRRAFLRILSLAVGLSLCLGGVALTVALVAPIRQFVLMDIQRVPDAETARRVAFILMAFCTLPLYEAVTRVTRGVLIRHHRAMWITSVYAISRTAAIIVALLALRTSWVQRQPLLLPAIVYQVDGFIRMSLSLVVTVRVVWPNLEPDGEAPSYWALLGFQYPMMLTSLMMSVSRPVINGFVSQMEDGKISLAVLALVFPLSNLFYGWTNDMRVLLPAFRGKVGSYRAIRRFAITTPVWVCAMMTAIFMTPLRDWLLMELMGVREELAVYCSAPLMIFCLFPFAVALRAYMQGAAVTNRATQAMIWSGPLRIVAIVTLLSALSLTSISGAVLGTLALLAGFVVEALTIVTALRRAGVRAI